MSNYQKVRKCHEKFNLALDLGSPSDDIVEKRIAFIEEEFNELKEAVKNNDRIKILDGLADILYVTYGMAAVYGFDIDEAYDRVYISNMSKTMPEDSSEKLIKGPDYIPVDLADLV